MILQNICLERYWLQLHNLSIMRSSHPPLRTNPMIKSQLVLKITDKYPELYQRDADLIVNTIFNEISEALARGDRVEIRGFGSFNTKETEAVWGVIQRVGKRYLLRKNSSRCLEPAGN